MPSETHYWIYVDSYEGKPFLAYGSSNSYAEAERKGYELLPCMFEIIELPTREITKASRMIRYRRLEETRDLTDSFRNIRHQVR